MKPDPPSDKPSPQESDPSIDETIEFGGSMDSTLDPLAETIDPFGMSERSKAGSGKMESTAPDIGETHEFGSVKLRPTQVGRGTRMGPPASVMSSADVGQTINPRELNAEDAAFWGSLAAAGASKANQGEVTNQRPAAERSINESKLQLRQRDLAPPTRDADEPSDYRLVRLLGRGGMGNVYVAKQMSLDRLLAVKVIKPLPKEKREKLELSGKLGRVEEDRRQQFLSEAVVTGDLDHPNIVPIHDVAVAADNTLFYAMKRVVGRPWSEIIEEKSRDENLEILLKVADALAFAHTRGVVHRDIKPENIMLGDFGEVLVMDWGLALAQPNFEKSESITHTAGLGGTPAFMAPEMATGPLQKIGPTSDIYLLGATLYYIITGTAPHHGEDVSQCIRNVAGNQIRAVEPQHEGELMDIAMMAMKTDPADRYQSVLDFQHAVRLYRSHAESIALESIARDHLTQAANESGYNAYSRATFGFEQAIALWPENTKAVSGLAAAKLAHAQAAYDNGDYDAGISILNASDSSHAPLLQKLREAIAERESRESRLTLFKRLAVASLAFIVVGGAVALYLINDQREQAIDARKIAEEKKLETQAALKVADANFQRAEKERTRAVKGEKAAKDATRVATLAKNEAIHERKVADDLRVKAEGLQVKAEQSATEALAAKQLAETRRREAETQRLAAEESARQARLEKAKAEYEVYLSQIGLAKARIDRNEFDDARRILTSLRQAKPDQVPAWEWRWLWGQSNQSTTRSDLASSVMDIAVSRSEEMVYAVDADSSILGFAISPAGVAATESSLRQRLRGRPTSVSVSGEGDLIAIGTDSGEVLIHRAADLSYVRTLSGHESIVNDVCFVGERILLTASSDRRVIVWDSSDGRKLDQCWHIAPVQQIDSQTIAESNAGRDDLVFAAAVSDSASGRVVAWRLSLESNRSRLEVTTERLGEFLEHPARVSAVGISRDGDWVASGDVEGNVYRWKPSQVQKTDFGSSIASAIKRVGENSRPGSSAVGKSPKTAFSALTDSSDEALVSTHGSSVESTPRAHGDAVRGLRFSRDGGFLLSVSDDYTVKRWSLTGDSKPLTLKGHGGWVTAGVFAGDKQQRLLTCSVDRTIRGWNPETYQDAFVAFQNPAPAREANARLRRLNEMDREQFAHGDEILAASFDAAGQRIVSASRDHTSRVLGVDRQTLKFNSIATMRADKSDRLSEGTEFLAMTAVVDQERGRAFIGSADSMIRIWDLKSGTQIGELRGTGLNNTMAISEDGNWLLSGSSGGDAKAILWDVTPDSDGPSERFRLGGHEQAVTALAISADSTRLFTGDRSGRGIVWDATIGRPLGQPIDLLRGYRINDAKFTNAGRSIWIAADDQQLTGIDLETGQPIRRLDHRGLVTSVSISGDSRAAVTVSESVDEKTVRSIATLWDLESGARQQLAEVKSSASAAQQNARITSAQIAADGGRAVITRQDTTGRTGQIAFVSIDRADGTPDWLALPAKIGAVQQACLLSSNSVLTLNGDAGFRWNLNTMAHEKSYRAHAAVTQAAFSADGTVVATASRSVKLWQAATGEAIDKLENPHQGAVRGVAFSPRSSPESGVYEFSTAGDHGMLHTWSWTPGKGFERKSTRRVSQSPILCLAYAPDGRSIAVGTRGQVVMWSLGQEDSPVRFEVDPTSEVNSVAFSRDGKWLLAGGGDKEARLWSLVDTAAEPIVFTGHADQIESVAIVQDASEQMRILTASRDKSARLWDPRFGSDDKVGREILTLRKHSQGVTAVDVTADGQLVMTAGRDGAVILWPAAID